MITGLIGMGINNEYINKRLAKASTDKLLSNIIKLGFKINRVKDNLNFVDDVKAETARKEAEYMDEEAVFKAVMSGDVDMSKLSPDIRQKAEMMLKFKKNK